MKKIIFLFLTLFFVTCIAACGSPKNQMKGRNFGEETPAYNYGRVMETQSNVTEDCYAVDKKYDEAAFDLYKADLEKAGYQQTFENKIEENSFAAYSNGELTIYVSDTPALDQMHITVEPVGLQCNEAQVINRYTADNSESLTVVGQNGEEMNFAMGYIFRLSDGRFVCIDGGYKDNDSAEWFYEQMKALTPEGEKIVVAAWILTHSHNDHCGTIVTFAQKYHARAKVEKLFFNFGMDEQYDASGQGYMYHDYIRELVAKGTFIDMQAINPHPGCTYDFGDFTLNYLYTSELLVGGKLSVFNATSTVFTVETAGQKFMFLGDTNCESAPVISDIYSADVLKSDVMQVAHHGCCEYILPAEFYQKINPAYVLWPSSTWNFDLEKNKEAEANRWILDTIPSENIWVSRSSVIRFSLPLSADGYELIRDTEGLDIHP